MVWDSEVAGNINRGYATKGQKLQAIANKRAFCKGPTITQIMLRYNSAQQGCQR